MKKSQFPPDFDKNLMETINDIEAVKLRKKVRRIINSKSGNHA